MKTVDDILQKINGNADIGEIRLDIANLILKCLTDVEDSFTYWEKAHLAHAIADLGRNINSKHQPSTAWLRLCLVTIEKAMIPPSERDEHYTTRDSELDTLTFDQLMDEITALGGGGWNSQNEDSAS